MTASSSDKLTAAVLRLALIIGIVVVLYFGQTLLLPLVLGGILAALVNPIDEKLRSWGWSRNFAITGAVFVLLLFFIGLFAAVGQQAVNFSQSWPQTQNKLETQLNKLREASGLGDVIPSVSSSTAADSTGGTGQPKEEGGGQESMMDKLPVSGSGILSFFSGTFGVLGDFLLMLVYVVLFLAQKERLREFIIRRMPDSERVTTHQTINESRDVVQKYLRGRLILILILTVLYSAGFLIVGLDYAVLIAVLVAVLSIIPYLGNLIGGVFAAALAFAGDGDATTAVIGVIVTMSVAQMLESYILTPLIVGDEVDINPLTTIVCVVGMSILWGPVGAIIAIPIFAILRIIFSHVDGLRDYAYLLGQK